MHTKVNLCPFTGTLDCADPNPAGRYQRCLDQALSGHGVCVPGLKGIRAAMRFSRWLVRFTYQQEQHSERPELPVEKAW